MVRREVDGSTLYFPGPDGAFVRVSMMDQQYNSVLSTFDEQLSAKIQNFHNLDIYKQKIANAQISIDASRNPGPLPAKPLRIVVSDPTIDEYGQITAGVQSEEVWTGLPEVKQK